MRTFTCRSTFLYGSIPTPVSQRYHHWSQPKLFIQWDTDSSSKGCPLWEHHQDEHQQAVAAGPVHCTRHRRRQQGLFATRNIANGGSRDCPLRETSADSKSCRPREATGGDGRSCQPQEATGGSGGRCWLQEATSRGGNSCLLAAAAVANLQEAIGGGGCSLSLSCCCQKLIWWTASAASSDDISRCGQPLLPLPMVWMLLDQVHTPASVSTVLRGPWQNRVTWKTPSRAAFVPLQEPVAILAVLCSPHANAGMKQNECGRTHIFIRADHDHVEA